MGFTDAVRSGFSNYVTFQGRAVRSEFWYWVLFTIIASIVLGIIEGLNSEILTSIFGLVTFLPGLAVAVRRLHDTDRSGWWVLLCLIPILGWLILIYFYVQPGTSGDNQYGEDRLN